MSVTRFRSLFGLLFAAAFLVHAADGPSSSVPEGASRPVRLIQGQIRHRGDKGLVLRSRQPAERVQGLLSAFVSANVNDWPTFLPLQSASFLQAV